MSVQPDHVNGVRRRRRLDVVLLLLAAVVVGVITSSVAAASGGERVAQLWVAATVADDGSARITEVIDWDFGPNDRHGIVRTVPQLRTSAPIEVSSPDAPDDVDVSTAGTPQIRVGDPDRTVRGLHRYVVTYTVDGVVSGDRLAWDAVGTTWTAPIRHIEVHVTAPMALNAAGCTAGTVGSRVACAIQSAEPGHLVARLDGLDTGEGVTVSATTGAALGTTPELPTPPAAAPSAGGVNPFLPGILAGGIALLAMALASVSIRRAGRECAPAVGMPLTASPCAHARIDLAELADHAVPSPSLPAGLSPAQGGLLLAGQVLDQHKAGWLIEQAVDGVIDLVPDDTRAEEITMVRVQPGDRIAAPLLDTAFQGRTRLQLDAYDQDFARMWHALGQELSGWQRRSGLWDADAERRARWTRVIGTLVGVAGVVLAVVGGYLSTRQTDLPLVLAAVGGALAGAGAAGAARGWELRVFTPKGSSAWLQVESLRRFLAQSPPTAVDELIASGKAGRYTAWAVALGEAQRWSQLASTFSSTARMPYDSRSLLYAGYAPMFLTHCCTASTAAGGSTGAGGGVSVGGGAGGGGGSSW